MGVDYPLKRLQLNNLKNTKRSFIRVIQAFNADLIEKDKYTKLIWGMGKHLEVLRIEQDREVIRILSENKDFMNEI